MSSPEEIILARLTEAKAGTGKKRQELADEIAEALGAAGYLMGDDDVISVEVHGARVAIERVEVYGLLIELDANGNAMTVSSPHGLFVTE